MSDTLETDAPAHDDMPPNATRLPSGGWAILRPLDELTGRDIKTIRRALNGTGTGDIMGAALAAGLAAVVADWQIPGRPQLPLPLHNAKSLDALPARDLFALESYVKSVVEQALGSGDEGRGGAADPS